MNFAPFDQINVPVFCFETAGRGIFRIIYVNSAYAHIMGESSDRLVTSQITISDDNPGRAALANFAHQALGQSPPFRKLEALQLSASQQPFDISIRRLAIEEGKAQQLLGTIYPLSTAKDLPHDTPQSLDTERFFALVAHDLRTPMRNVQSIAEALLEDLPKLSAANRELVEMLGRVGHKAGLLIEDVITYVNANTLESRDQDINLDDFCRDLLFALDPQGKHTVSAQPVRLRVNTTALSLIFNNLMENATRNGERDRLAFALRPDPAPDGMVSFHYSDNGLGFSGLDNIVSDDRAARWNAGFGLASIRRIVLAEGGTIALARSEFGDGAGLTFTLPATLLTT